MVGGVADDDPVATANAYLERMVPVVAGMGVRFTDLRPGFVRASAPFEGNGNHFGVVYAGVIFSLAEVLGGGMHLATFDASTHYPLVRKVEVEFLSPGRSDLTATAALPDAELEAVREQISAGAPVPLVLTAEVAGEDGIVVARTRGDYQLRPFDR
jgi:acyl-coenzyme A thioesterase PaaI-like protein